MRGNLKAFILIFDSPHPTPLQQERGIFLNIMAVTLERGNEKAAYLFADDSPLDRIDSVTSLPIPR
jgi:hypothetical protein